MLWRPLRRSGPLRAGCHALHSTPLVGRELERQLLIGTFERAAQQQSCQLVTIVGEPGVGKSRLCAELFAYLEQRPGLVRWRQGRCLPYGDGIALLGTGRDRQGGVRHPRIGHPGAGGRRSSSRPSPEDDRGPSVAPRPPGAAGWRARRAGRQEESFAAWRRFSRASLQSGRRCSCSRICTGPTPPCSPSSSISPMGGGRAAAALLHGAAGTVRAASDVRRRMPQRTADQPRSRSPTRRPPSSSRRSWSERCCRPRRSRCCWSGREATRCTRRSSSVCSRTAALRTASTFRNRCRR